MGREVRMVPPTWAHPKHDGRFVPMHDGKGGGAIINVAEWDEEYAAWQAGKVKDYGPEKWRDKAPDELGLRYTDWAGPRPSPDDYMPDWPAEQRTHWMMYESTSEGTPISPAFATPEELARWLADTGASAFGSSTLTYDQWLAKCLADEGGAP